ncbi:MAG: hypothetical protein HRU38_18295 [Saccharospirillaceae bacterium]|nr:hypothetical protein [Pseudomonadales bacterium]NRB80588.1 hypothetical protein [Saccharospirillaceae bacterium]
MKTLTYISFALLLLSALTATAADKIPHSGTVYINFDFSLTSPSNLQIIEEFVLELSAHTNMGGNLPLSVDLSLNMANPKMQNWVNAVADYEKLESIQGHAQVMIRLRHMSDFAEMMLRVKNNNFDNNLVQAVLSESSALATTFSINIKNVESHYIAYQQQVISQPIDILSVAMNDNPSLDVFVPSDYPLFSTFEYLQIDQEVVQSLSINNGGPSLYMQRALLNSEPVTHNVGAVIQSLSFNTIDSYHVQVSNNNQLAQPLDLQSTILNLVINNTNQLAGEQISIGDIIQLNNELMLVTAINNNQLSITRGHLLSKTSEHNNNDILYLWSDDKRAIYLYQQPLLKQSNDDDNFLSDTLSMTVANGSDFTLGDLISIEQEQ